MKKSNSRVNPFREPPPNYETMKPRHKEAKRVFYMLHEILEARHERPIIMFHRLDEDESGTVTQVELRKGLAGLDPPIKKSHEGKWKVFSNYLILMVVVIYHIEKLHVKLKSFKVSKNHHHLRRKS